MPETNEKSSEKEIEPSPVTEESKTTNQTPEESPTTESPSSVPQDNETESSTPEEITSQTESAEPESPPEVESAPAEPEPPVSEPEDEVLAVDTLKDKPRYDEDEFQKMSSLYEQSLKEIREGEIVRGRIVAIAEKEIAVDIGFKAEGTIPMDEFTDPETLHIGDEIAVFLDRVEDKEGQLVLSKRKADFMETWEKLLQYYETQEVLKGTITRRIKGGMVVDVMNIDCFLPGSQIDIHPIRDFDALVGKDMEFRIVKVNELRKNIVLSHKVLIEESLAEVREKMLLEMDVGLIMEGMVKNITDFGVFIDLGGVDGLLHITDLSWGRISHPSEVVELDQKINVMITDIDPVRRRVSVGLKQLLPHPWEGVEERYPLTSRITGRVVSITNYGAFIELEKGVEGLIHVSEMSWTQHIKHPSTLLSIGDEVEAVVLSMDVNERKISLGMKQIEPDPWETLEEKYAVGSRHKGVVRELVPFGAFVELEDGIEGLVHISDLSWTKKVRHPAEVVKKGEDIEVIIIGFDRNERRIALGYKQIKDSPWEIFATEYAVSKLTTGKVVRLIDKGVIVELPKEVEGFIPNSQLGRDKQGSIRKRLNPGDELELVVVEFEKSAKRIVLSAIEARKLKERKDYQEYVKEQDKAEAVPVEKPKEEKKAKPKTDKPTKPAAEEAEPAKEVTEAPEEPAPEVETAVEEPAPAPEPKKPKEAKARKPKEKAEVPDQKTEPSEKPAAEPPVEKAKPEEPTAEAEAEEPPPEPEPEVKPKKTKKPAATKAEKPKTKAKKPAETEATPEAKKKPTRKTTKKDETAKESKGSKETENAPKPEKETKTEEDEDAGANNGA